MAEVSEIKASTEDTLSLIFDAGVNVDDMQHQTVDGVDLIRCTMRYRETSNGDTVRKFCQSAIVLNSTDLDLPAFHARPTPTGILNSIAKAFFGEMAAIKFDDSPEFSSAYYLTGYAEQAVRIVFTRALRAELESFSRYSVRALGSSVVLYVENQVLKDELARFFVPSALKILAEIKEGGQRLEAQPEVPRDPRGKDFYAAAERFGMVGKAIRKQLKKNQVTEEQLEIFLNSSVPRNIPRGVKLQVMGPSALPVWLGFVVLGGITLTAGLLMPDATGKSILMSAGGVMATIGAIGVYWMTSSHRRKATALREGELIDGHVTKVERMRLRINNSNVYSVMLDFPGAPSASRSTKIQDHGVARAKRLAASGRPVRVLASEGHTVCIDLLTVW